MKKFSWTRATGLAAALFLTAAPVSAQILGGLPVGGGGGGAGGSSSSSAGGGAGGAAGGGTGGSVGLGNRLDLNRSARGINAAQAARGATGAAAGGRTSVGLGAGAGASAGGVNASAGARGSVRTRTGLFSSTQDDSSSNTSAGADGDLGVQADVERGASVSGRERASQQAELTLNHRLAEIDQIRDRAVASGNTKLLAQADEMEAQARATYEQRVDGQPNRPQDPPGQSQDEPPRNVRSRIQAAASGDVKGRLGARTAPATEDAGGAWARGQAIAGADAAGDNDIEVARPEDFGRMRHRATATTAAAAAATASTETESRGRLTFAPKKAPRPEANAGGETDGGARSRGAASDAGEFQGQARERVAGSFDTNGMPATGAWASQGADARVRPAANSRFAGDLREQGNVRGGTAISGHSVSRTDADLGGQPLPRGERGAQIRGRAIEQVEYTGDGVGAAGQASGRVTGAAYSRGEAGLGESPFGQRGGQVPVAEARTDSRAAARARSEWDDLPDLDVRSDARQQTEAGLRRTAEVDSSVRSATRFSGRVDTPPARRPAEEAAGDVGPFYSAGEAPQDQDRAQDEVRGRVSSGVNARGSVFSDEVGSSGSSRLQGNASRSGATFQSRQSAGASLNRQRTTQGYEELPAPRQ